MGSNRIEKDFYAILFLLILCVYTGCCQKKELSVKDFRFDGELGSEGAKIEKLAKNCFRVKLGHSPNKPDWNNKLAFQITGNAKGNDLTLYVEGVSKYRMKEYFCSYSYDMENWNPVHWKNGRKRRVEIDTICFPVFQENIIWVGHQVPLSYNQVEGYVHQFAKNSCVKVHTLGKSLLGRNLYRLTITGDSKGIDPRRKWVHYFINSHPEEHNAQWRMIGMIEWLLGEQAKRFRNRTICHFVLMMSPDAPARGWWRVNAQGIDMNRSYFSKGSDKDIQGHEPYIFQADLEQLMSSDCPVTTLWGMHTWEGKVEPMLFDVEDNRVGAWTDFRDILIKNDKDSLIMPLVLRSPEYGFKGKTWEYGPHLQFGIKTILCEGSGDLDTKEENKKSGMVLIKSLAEYYPGLKK